MPLIVPSDQDSQVSVAGRRTLDPFVRISITQPT
jgi:hypothetical protein